MSDARAPVTISMQDLMGLAGRMLGAANDVAEIEEKLKEAKAKHAFIEQELMPAAMRELYMEQFTLSDGRLLKLSSKVSAQISEASAPLAFQWLEEQGLDGVIKNMVAVEFGKGENEYAQEVIEELTEVLRELCEKHSLPVTDWMQRLMQKRGVHPQTLLKTMRDCLAEGKSPPEDVFNLWLYDRVEVKMPK